MRSSFYFLSFHLNKSVEAVQQADTELCLTQVVKSHPSFEPLQSLLMHGISWIHRERWVTQHPPSLTVLLLRSPLPGVRSQVSLEMRGLQGMDGQINS